MSDWTEPGRKAPDFTLADTDGNRVTLGVRRGSPRGAEFLSPGQHAWPPGETQRHKPNPKRPSARQHADKRAHLVPYSVQLSHSDRHKNALPLEPTLNKT